MAAESALAPHSACGTVAPTLQMNHRNRTGLASAAAESPRRTRIGRGRVFAWIKQQVGAGGIEITAAAVSRQFNWLPSSARDCLQGLVADGLLRVAGRAGPRGPTLYELTAAGAAARSKVCRTCHSRKSESGFWTSRWTADGLAEVCKACIDHAKKAGRHDGAARRAARVAAP
jgi:hypothetical protein